MDAKFVYRGLPTPMLLAAAAVLQLLAFSAFA